MAAGHIARHEALVLIALIVVAVVTSVAYLEVQSFEQHIEGDLMDSARLGAQSAADNVAQRPVPFDTRDVQDSLHDLVPPIRSSMRSR
jgi:hypothetical protein